MDSQTPRALVPDATPRGIVTYRVPFYDTDAMGIVHHSNYLRYLELARVDFIERHDQPYAAYVARGLHIAVSHARVNYRRPCRFGDDLRIECWINWVKQLSLQFGYIIHGAGEQLLLTAETEHVCIDNHGRPARLPRDRRERLSELLRASSLSSR